MCLTGKNHADVDFVIFNYVLAARCYMYLKSNLTTEMSPSLLD